MKLCSCATPTRDPNVRDRRRCSGCSGWCPPARTIGVAALNDMVSRAAKFLPAVADEYVWAAAYTSTQSASVAVRTSTVANPTANTACDLRAALVGSWRRLAASFVLEALHALELADAALGEARYACDPGPRDHVKAEYHDDFPPVAMRSDIQAAYEAKARRQARGEDWGVG